MYTRVILSAVINGIITVGTSLLSVATDGAITKNALLVACIGGTLALFKDLQAYLSQPPQKGAHNG